MILPRDGIHIVCPRGLATILTEIADTISQENPLSRGHFITGQPRVIATTILPVRR